MTGVRPTVVLVGHGGLARGVLDAAEMILGTQRDVHALDLGPAQDPAEVAAAAREAARPALEREEGEVLVLADLFGGSPANALAAAFLDEPRAHLITGLNVPMLLAILTGTGADLADAAVRAGREGVIDAGARLRQRSGHA